jgi:hypothetical protein
MRIALWNAGGLDNLGDRLLDAVNRREIGRRIPGAQFASFCPWADAGSPAHLWVDTDGHWPGEGAFDSIVIGGGALLVGPPFRHPGLQAFFLGPYPERFADTCPVVWNAVCSDTQRPAPAVAAWREYVCGAAGRIGLRTVRNESTRACLWGWGVGGDIAVVPDPVVLWCGDGERRRPGRREGRRRIGALVARPVFPSHFLMKMGLWAMQGAACSNPAVIALEPYTPAEAYEEPRYVRQYAEVLRPLTGDYQLEICVRPSMYGDEEPAQLVAAALGPAATSVRVRDPWGADLLAWMESLDCVIATRLHDCILALLAGTPVLAVDPYARPSTPATKLREFMRMGQGEDHYLTLESFLTGDIPLPDRIERALVAAPELAGIREGLQARASAHFDALIAALA